MSNILIEANNITKIYDPDILLKRGKNFYALDNVNFVLEKGDFVCIMGPSGSGKSTLLNCLSTLDNVSSGHIHIQGVEMTTLPKDQLCQFRYESLGFVFQDHNLIPYLSVFDNIATPALLGKQNPKELEKKIKKLAQDLQIQELLDKFPNECSGGECQRIAIARALINDPEIIFCDEPTGNLDSKNSHKVLNILSQLNQNGTTILLVTHDPMIASYAKTMMYLYDGGIKTIVHKNNNNQVDFFKKINEITTQDSLLHEFASTEEISTVIPEQENIETIHVEDKDKEFVTRENVYMSVVGMPTDETIAKHNTPCIINGTLITYRDKRNDEILFDLTKVKTIHLDLKSSYTNFGIFSQFVFYPLVDLITESGTCKFMAKNKDDFSQIIHHFHSLNIPLDDPRGIEEAYHKYPHDLERCKFFQRTHKDLIQYGSYDQPDLFKEYKDRKK